jgi:hypothetical protein
MYDTVVHISTHSYLQQHKQCCMCAGSPTAKHSDTSPSLKGLGSELRRHGPPESALAVAANSNSSARMHTGSQTAVRTAATNGNSSRDSPAAPSCAPYALETAAAVEHT